MIRVMTIQEARELQLQEVCEERFNCDLDNFSDRLEAAEVYKMVRPQTHFGGTYSITGVPTLCIVVADGIVKAELLQQLKTIA